MPEKQDVIALVRSRIPLVVIETREELRMLDVLRRVGLETSTLVYRWSVTEGLSKLGSGPVDPLGLEPGEMLRHIWGLKLPGIFVLLDFHPYLAEPRNVRLLREVCQSAERYRQTVVLLSHRVDLPDELRHHAARLAVRFPDEPSLARIVDDMVRRATAEQPRRTLTVDPEARAMLIRNLTGLSAAEATRLARQAVMDDHALTMEDVPRMARAKYELLNRDGVLHYEHDTARFTDVGGLENLKRWLGQRRPMFLGETRSPGLDTPKGILLLGVQGSGKSLAAKAVAGAWHIPLLRLDFGALYDKYYGETERKTRDSLGMAEMMAPCVLWFDEIEKGIAARDSDSGTAHRVLGTLLTWMAERRSKVFVVATANDISTLPPELLRKGRLDEVFFVDLPEPPVRREILAIHLRKRGLDPAAFDLEALAEASDGFSGSELEQAVVAGFYGAAGDALDQRTLLEELRATRPLSVLMAEQIGAMRDWAEGRTVRA